LVTAERTHGILVELGSCARHDPGTEFFAVFLVGHANHLHVLDVRVPVQKLLDSPADRCFAAADDHVLDRPTIRQ